MIQDLTTHLPNVRFLQENFSYVTNENAITSNFDDGTVYKRRLYVNAPSTITGSFFLSIEQAKIFRNFYSQQLKDGTQPFYFTNPLTNLKTRMICIANPVYSFEGGRHLLVTIQARVFENDTI